jgi:hypothetical protein
MPTWHRLVNRLKILRKPETLKAQSRSTGLKISNQQEPTGPVQPNEKIGDKNKNPLQQQRERT